jgi:thioesterase domain-containing protein/malonyl CoA-acyl carrier protein transacylase/acyl carrier protein
VAEAPPRPAPEPSRPRALLLLSARTPVALEAATDSLRAHFQARPGDDAADAAFTLATGRRPMEHRRWAVCQDARDAVTVLRERPPARSGARRLDHRDPAVIFMFPGQGAQYAGMGRSLYEGEPVFRRAVDECSRILRQPLGRDLREVLYPSAGDGRAAGERLAEAQFAQPALFVVEHALAELWRHWGVAPRAMIGHGVGEYVAARLSGVLSLPDALRLVAERARLIQALPRGSMLVVSRPAAEVERRLPPAVQVAAVNAPSLCVVSGPVGPVAELGRRLEAEGIPVRPLRASHALHSAMMDPAVEELTAAAAGVQLSRPTIPFISGVTGAPIRDEEATDPCYWGRHLRLTVRFADGARELARMEDAIFLEVGPRGTLCAPARQSRPGGVPPDAAPSLGETAAEGAEWDALLAAMGQLWCHGVTVDWRSFYEGERRRHVPLPTYPFEEASYWVDPVVGRGQGAEASAPAPAVDDAAEERRADFPPPAAGVGLRRSLADVFTEVSGIDAATLGSGPTFLELGMDSLMLTQAASKLRGELGLTVSFNQLMQEYPTLDLLETHCARVIELEPVASPPVAAPSAPQILPSTTPQHGIWLSSMLADGLNCSYNESMTVRLRGRVDLDALLAAIQALYERHEALRGVFSGDGATMTVRPAAPLEIPVVDARDWEGTESGPSVSAAVTAEAAAPFSLENRPLFRSRILRTGDEELLVTLTAHHIICDGWSLDVLVRDLCALYADAVGSTDAVRVLAPPQRYAAYSTLLQERSASQVFARDRAYWHEVFADGFPVLHLPTDFPRGAVRTYAARRMDRVLPAGSARQMQLLGARNGCSLFTLLVAGLAAFLSRLSGQERFVLGLPIAEQPSIGLEGLVGQCVCLLPARCDMEGDPSFGELLARVNSRLLDAYEHQSYTFIHLLNDLPSARADGRASVLSAGLTSVKKWDASELPCPPGIIVDYDANPKSFESFEAYLNVVVDGPDLVLRCHFQTQLFSETTIRRWLEELDQCFALVVKNPETRLSGIPVDACAAAAPWQAVPAAGTARGAPRTKMERQLFALWRKLLGAGVRSVDDNFFDLGGHSILAARLFAETERLIGQAVPLSLLYRAPTIRELAAAITAQDSPAAWKSLVPIQAGGTRPPLFLIHGAEGNVLLYRQLARSLGPDHPVYGLQAAGLSGSEPLDPDFGRTAARYIREMRTVQPKGPYHLGGYCLGGTIALEMAHQLRAQGEQVGLVAMIEDYNVNSLSWPLPKTVRWVNKALNVYFHLHNMLAAEKGHRMGFFMQKLRVEVQRMRSSASIMGSRMRGMLGLSSGLRYHHTRVDKAFDDALARYIPPSYPGTVTLFMAQRRFMGFPDHRNGWGGVARDVVVHLLPMMPRGSLIEPYVDELAALIRDAMP